jgi:uncharacterized protein (UPF0548 family)
MSSEEILAFLAQRNYMAIYIPLGEPSEGHRQVKLKLGHGEEAWRTALNNLCEAHREALIARIHHCQERFNH